MAAEKQVANSTPTKSLRNADGSITKLTEFATADINSVEELETLFGSQGVSYSRGEEVTGDYKVITKDEKVAFCKRILGKKLGVVRWAFRDSSTGEYVTMHIIVDGAGKFIFNDGAGTGMYGQLSATTTGRIANGMSESEATTGLIVDRGIKQNNPYEYDTRTGKSIKKGQD